MTINYRLFSGLIFSTLFCMLPASSWAQADAYPTKPIRLVVPFSPGAANDTIARLIAQKVGESMGQSIVVENRAGGGGGVGANAVAKAKPDGYTLLLVNPGPGIITPLLTREKTYAVADLSPIVVICQAPLIIVSSPDFGPKNPAELLAYARANPGKVKFGSADAGGVPGLALKLFQVSTNADVLDVPYKGSTETIAAVLSNTIDLVYVSYASAQSLVVGNRLRVLGVAGPKRIPAAPNAMTLSESGITNADAVVWFGLAAPRGTPKTIIDYINREVNKALTLPDVKQRLSLLELEVTGGTTEEFQARVTREAALVSGLIKSGKLAVE